MIVSWRVSNLRNFSPGSAEVGRDETSTNVMGERRKTQMRTKVLVAILLLTIFVSSSIIGIIGILPASADTGNSKTLTLPEAELMIADFASKAWGPGTISSRTDIAGSGVQFNFTGLDSGSGTGVKDDFPVDSLAGGAMYSGHPSDFTRFTRYSMSIKNVGTGSVQVCLFMNTGFTSIAGWRDTFWQGAFVSIAPGEYVVAELDFSHSDQAWNIADDLEFTGHTNGEHGTAVWRLNEVTSLGFQVLGDGAGSIVLSGTQLYIDPPVTNKVPTDVGTTFNVNVTLADFKNLSGFDIKLIWNSTLITKTAVDYTTPLNALWGVGAWSVFFEQNIAGSYELVVVALGTSVSNVAASNLFTVTFRIDRCSNFPLSTSIHFSLVKLSDDTEPIPNPIPATATDGVYNMSAERPDLEFNLRDPNTLKPFEYGKIFEIEVNATHISATLKDYDFTILYDPEFLICTEVSRWGVLGDNVTGQAQYTITPGSIHVWDTGGSNTYTGDDGFLFALRLQIVFDGRIQHIWRKNTPHDLTANIQFGDAQLSFLEGTIPMSGINTPSTQVVTIHLIRGDVRVDGKVDIVDISDAAYSYGQSAPPAPEKYDLNQDGIIDIYDLVAIATNYGYYKP